MKNSRDREYADVQRFHEKLGMMEYSHPGHLSKAAMRRRIKFLREELDELERAEAENDLPEQVDALIDLVYVAKGTGHQLGISWEAHWDEVQRANLAKEPGETKRGFKRDAVKPAGWRPPDHASILARFGYDRSAWVDQNGLLIPASARDDEREEAVDAGA